MEWKTEFEQLKEKIELLNCASMEYEDALEIKEALEIEFIRSK